MACNKPLSEKAHMSPKTGDGEIMEKSDEWITDAQYECCERYIILVIPLKKMIIFSAVNK